MTNPTHPEADPALASERPALAPVGARPALAPALASERPGLAVGLLAILAAVKLALHLLTNHGYGYFIDELYYLACSEHLDWGYVDHPPGIAAITWLVRHLLGDSLPALRFFPALAGAATVFLAGMIARELGGRRFAQGLAALAVLAAPLFLFGNTILSMNAFDVTLCTLALWLLARILGQSVAEEGTTAGRLWLLLGVVLGLGLLNKLSPLFLGFGLAVGLLLTPERRRLATRGPWLAGGLAGLIFLPHVLWQIRHGWPTLEFMHNAATLKNKPLPPLQFFFMQALEVQPLNFLLLLAGLVWLLAAPRDRPYRVFGWLYLAVFAVFAFGNGKPYYLGPFYPLMLAAGAVALEQASEAWRLGWLRPAFAGLLALAGLVLAPLALPLLPVESFIAYQKAILGGTMESSEKTSVGPLPQHFADMFGHEELVQEVAKVFHALPPAEQAQTVIYADSYGEAGSIDLFGPRYGLPKAVASQNSYWLWGPGPIAPKTLIVLGGEQEEHYDACTEVTLGGRFHHPYVMPRSNDEAIWICRGLKGDLRAFWPQLKNFI